MIPQLGSMLIYRLTAADAEAVNRRRTTGEKIAKRIAIENWCIGAQAHIGNEAKAGQCFPMMVVNVDRFHDVTSAAVYEVNGQVFLDGNDVLWVQGVSEGPRNGTWYWPAVDGCTPYWSTL